MYKISFKNSYNKKSRVSKDVEILEVFVNRKRIRVGKAHYTHRWWTRSELDSIFKGVGFSSVKFSSKGRRSEMLIMVAKK